MFTQQLRNLPAQRTSTICVGVANQLTRALLLTGVLAIAANPQSFKTQSEIAHARGEIGRARELLLKAAAEGGSDADRAEVERRLARLA